MKAQPAKEEHRPFVTDIQELRRRARVHMEQGAVTSAYNADRETVIRILNEVLATEIVCVLRYKRHYYMATGIHAQAVAQEFLEHANEEQGHADIAAERITQFGGRAELQSRRAGNSQPCAVRRRQIASGHGSGRPCR